jgi:hypothetical protein
VEMIVIEIALAELVLMKIVLVEVKMVLELIVVEEIDVMFVSFVQHFDILDVDDNNVDLVQIFDWLYFGIFSLFLSNMNIEPFYNYSIQKNYTCS